MKRLLIIISFFLFTGSLLSQSDTIQFKTEDYSFTAIYVDTNYVSSLTIKKSGKVIYESAENDRITEIAAYDLDDNGQKEIVIGYYTGGAHCCVYLTVCTLKGDKVIAGDTLFWGDSSYEIVDIDKDGSYEIKGVFTGLGYAFTNFAQSMFPVIIFRYEKGKFKEVTGDFPKLVKEDIKKFETELKEYTKTGFDCPKTEDDETFNTDAGAVKAILAAIVHNYYSLGSVNTGYDFVKKTYKCVDQKKFINILKTDYKLK